MAGVAAFTLVSCDDGNEGAIYNMPAEEQGYSFLTESAGASYGPAYTEKTYSFKMARNFAGEAETLALTCEGANPLFTVPTSVEFKAGETLADVTIGIAGMETGKSYSFTLGIDSAKVSSLGETKGIAKTELTFAVDYSWTKMGVCEVSDDWSSATVEIDLEYAPEYESADVILCRFANMEYLLEPNVAVPGYHFQFFLAKGTYDPVGTAATVQAMGESDSDYGNFYWIYSPASGHTFTREYNVYALSGYVGYDSFGSSISAGWYYNLEFTWTEGWTGDLPEEGGDDEEPEEEAGNGFGAIVAGGTADDYAGTYTATFLNDGKKEGSAEVTLTKVDDNTINVKGLFDESGMYDFEETTGFNLDIYGGLLYFQPGQVIGKNKLADAVTVYTYDSETGYFFDDAMLVGGFKGNGDIQFVNYSYNGDDAAVDGIISIFVYVQDGQAGYYSGATAIPCSIVLTPAEQAEAPAKSIKTVAQSLEAARSFFNVKGSHIMGNIRIK